MSLLLLFVGASGPVDHVAPDATGGIATSGTALHAFGKVWTATGGLAFSGTALHAKGWAYTPAGGLAFSGTAAHALGKAWTPAGGVEFSGAATTFGPGASPPTTVDLDSATLTVAGQDLTFQLQPAQSGSVLFDDFGAKSYFDFLDRKPGGVEPVLGPAEERPAGGYGWRNEQAAARQRERAKSRLRARWTAEDEAELAALLAAIPDEPDVAEQQRTAELKRLKALVNEYAAAADAELLSKRAQRALDFAQRAQTEMAYQLAAREIERQQEDEAMAVLIALASDD